MHEKVLLKDTVAKRILLDPECHDYLISIISKVTNIDRKVLDENLVLLNPQVSVNKNIKDQEVDSIFEIPGVYFNIEFNYTYYEMGIIKNITYVAQLTLRQIDIGKPYPTKDYRKVYQINIDNYYLYAEGKFVYHTVLMEKNLKKQVYDYFEIIDINLGYLDKLGYNEEVILNRETLENLLYIFVCENKDILDKIYSNNKAVRIVRDKMANLMEDFDSILYYNREEFLKDAKAYEIRKAEEKGIEKGRVEEKIEIAKNLLKTNLTLEEIANITGLSLKEVEKLKK